MAKKQKKEALKKIDKGNTSLAERKAAVLKNI
jgi:hypothetical protein